MATSDLEVPTTGRQRTARPHPACRRRRVEQLESLLAPGRHLHAETPLRAFAAHHHHADDPAAVRGHASSSWSATGSTVTQRLSTATTRDIAAIVDMIETYPNDAGLRERHPHRAGSAFAEDRHPAARPLASSRSASRSSPSSTRSFRRRSPGRSTGRSGSTRSAIPACSRCASSWRTRCCASSSAADRPTRRTPTSSSSGWSAPRSCC